MTVRCHYTIVRFVPNIVRNECVNVGVILQALDRPFIKARFTGRLARIRSLWPEADRGIVHIARRELRSRFRAYEEESRAQLDLIAEGPEPAVTDPAFLEYLHREYSNNIQFTAPAPTTACGSLDGELDELYQVYVAEEGPFVWRSPAVKLAPAGQREKIVNHLRRHGYVGRGRLHENVGLPGASNSQWFFDLGRRDDKGMIVQILSLDVAGPQPKLQRSLILAGMVEDVAQRLNDLTSVAIVFPPSTNGTRADGYKESLNILKQRDIYTVEVSQDVDSAVKATAARLGL